MNEETGLRERKKQRTRELLSKTAIELFLERGFDQVSVAEVAAAAEVSKPTLFRYFPAKEDLVLHGIADHQGEAARVVRGRAPGERPLAALRAHFHERLDAHDPITGLCDVPAVLAYRDLLYGTPGLLARLTLYALEDERELAAALGEAGADGMTARLGAAQIITVHQVLARGNWERLADGASAAAVLGDAHMDADRAYELLGDGLGVRGL
ncbi:TetR/AcrR family transcriptional regulator [Streptomyces albireticuli]|uniref:TetR family transcriptional regulator n=1 Tax=Streptomyces albireticuli TaxID=1940 RepID=A0A2A2D7E0_9ACTN|nr:TetR family transcriptional regulator [Streptomyces albireticuli]MCD9144143.1 TetR family transcriptional regulator [Streptomyces albireticuli]MCD9162214.1 TetR family transcriptional regulator [Streptomyces albireticuli]MCD9193780.1 TetR family transcriptional regulator [Streptomyces albireticuli]PAU47242.1 TetR family transcriptional regulator [Streptomyces albireticuli]